MPLKNHLFAYGFRESLFVVYKLNPQLKITDSLFYKPEAIIKPDYLTPESDTLNGNINFYLHRGNKLPLHVLITDTSLKFKKEFKNIEVTKLKPFSGLTEQTFHSGKQFYIIKTAADSAGKNYYLSQYDYLPGTNTPYDYRFNWQFNFERKHIAYLRVFYADKKVVYIYVNLVEGVKKGQWILAVNAQNGLLLKSKRLNFNPDVNYSYCNYLKDTISKSVFVTGQITTSKELTSASPTLYIAGFDSTLEYTGQKQFSVKLSTASKSKQVNTYLLQIPEILPVSPQQFTFYSDIYRQDGNSFKYHLSAGFTFTMSENEWLPPSLVVKEFTEIENFYTVKDVKDPNGKLEKDNISEQYSMFHTPPLFPVKLAFRINENSMPEWCLNKIDLKSNVLKIVTFKPGIKTYSLQPLAEIYKLNGTRLIKLNKETILISGNLNTSTFELILKKW